jgi:hypothetical protein
MTTTRTLLGAALALALAAIGLTLEVGQAVDIEITYPGDGGLVQATARCVMEDAGLDCGDLPEGAEPHANTASRPYATTLLTRSGGTTTTRDQPCACGVRTRDTTCRVFDPEADAGREPAVGEYLPAGRWTGACRPRPCWEVASVGAAGYSLPAECAPAVPAGRDGGER